MKFFKNKIAAQYKALNTVKIIVLAGLIGVGVSFVSAAWQAPVSAPTANNPEAPINVGATSQTKTGGIWASFFGTLGGAYFDGDVGIGVENPQAKLHVNGDISLADPSGAYPDYKSITLSIGAGMETIQNPYDANDPHPVFNITSGHDIMIKFDSDRDPDSDNSFNVGVGDDPCPTGYGGVACLGFEPILTVHRLGRVGINMASADLTPSEALYVNGNIYATGDITCGGSCAGGGGGGYWQSSGYGIYYDGDNEVEIGQDEQYASRYLTLWTENGSEAVQKFMEADVYGMGLRYVANDNKIYFDRYNNSTSPEAVMTLRRDNGYVGIGTTNPGYELEVAGDIAYWYGIYDISDGRLKENIMALTGALPKLEQINGVYFNKKGELNRGREVGVVAQDVEKVLPEAVSEGEDGYKRVDYTKLVPLLIEAVKEQQTQIETLKQEVETLKSR